MQRNWLGVVSIFTAVTAESNTTDGPEADDVAREPQEDEHAVHDLWEYPVTGISPSEIASSLERLKEKT